MTRRVPRAVEGAFGLLARLRSGRALHTRGTAFDARLELDAASALGTALGGPAERPAAVRLSKSVSLPGRLPDLLGAALRVPAGDGPFDVLLASVGRHDADHVLLLPSTGWWSRPYSTILPYRVDGRLVVLGLAPPAAPSDASPAGAAGALARGPVELTVTEQPLGGRRRRAGRLVLEEVRPGDGGVTYDPILNTHPRAHPVKLLSGLREWAYTGSRRGRRADPATLRTPP